MAALLQQPITLPAGEPPAFLVTHPDARVESVDDQVELIFLTVCDVCGRSRKTCACDEKSGYEELIYNRGVGLNVPLFESLKKAAKPAQPVTSFFHSIALPLAARGLKVIPINRDKSCTLTDHPKLATSDPGKIAQWVGPAFDNQNVGVHCLQEPGGVVIVDRDSKTIDLWSDYTAETRRPKPVSYEVQSTPPSVEYPFGKSHLYFLQTPRTLALQSNIPETATGGRFSLRLKNYYVAGENSIHPVHGGPYTAIQNAPIVPMPDDLLDWLLSKAPASEKKPLALVGEPIPHGEHEPTLFRIGCKMREIGAEEEAIYDAICEVCLKRCVNYGADWQEMCRRIAKNVVNRYPVGKPERQLTIGGKPAIPDSTTPIVIAEPVAWKAPLPFTGTALSPVLPFKLEFLPTSFQPWVRDVAERMSVPLDYPGICALVTLAGVVNRRAFVHPKQLDKEWKESLSISGAVVARSGQLKTPTWKVFTNVLIDIECVWREQYKEKLKHYEQLMKRFEADKSPLAVAPEKPFLQRVIANDSTPEKMHEILSDNPAGLFVYRDEMSGWVAELDRDDRKQARELYLSAMNGNDPYTMDRVGRGSVTAIMSASLFGGFQPELLADFLSNMRNINDGLIPRFGLLVWPDSVVLPRVDRPADEQAKLRFRHILKYLVESSASTIFLHFAPQAQSRFNEWLDKHDAKVSHESNPGKQSHLSKYRGLLPKLAGLLQLADVVDVVPTLVGNHLIDVDHLDRAISLLEYLESHMQRVYSCIKTPLQKAEDMLAMHLREGDLSDGFSIRQIKRNRWSNLSQVEYIEDAIQSLEELNWIRRRPQVQGAGRPTDRWDINPALETSK